MAISPYDHETRQRAVRLYFEELADGASSKAAALRAVEAVIGIKTSTIGNWAGPCHAWPSCAHAFRCRTS
ncbi:hypothetical protein CENDO_05300 [Corynebacterium endometrii]|uniref:Transposase n=1 Tax=Corynebacterium endometrii TaxID=2488819 RepID=A0A4P7QFB0_9CORY|nr:hypothetical protein CENDO_05300 [Corynebacterium endometrii]